MFSRKFFRLVAIVLLAPALLLGGMLLGQVASDRKPQYPGLVGSPEEEAASSSYDDVADQSSAASGVRSYNPPSEFSELAEEEAVASPAEPGWGSSPATDKRNNPLRSFSQATASDSWGYASSPPPPKPMTESEIDELLEDAGPVPGESHDEWLAQVERADAWLTDRTKKLVAQYQAAETDDERLLVKTTIKALSEKHFDIRHKSRDLEVLKLEQRLAEIRAAIAKRNDSKDLIVQVRVSALLGEIEWDDWAMPKKSGDAAKTPLRAANVAYPTGDRVIYDALLTPAGPRQPQYGTSSTYQPPRSTPAKRQPSGYTQPAYASPPSSGPASPLPSVPTPPTSIGATPVLPDRFIPRSESAAQQPTPAADAGGLVGTLEESLSDVPEVPQPAVPDSDNEIEPLEDSSSDDDDVEPDDAPALEEAKE